MQLDVHFVIKILLYVVVQYLMQKIFFKHNEFHRHSRQETFELSSVPGSTTRRAKHYDISEQIIDV